MTVANSNLRYPTAKPNKGLEVEGLIYDIITNLQPIIVSSSINSRWKCWYIFKKKPHREKIAKIIEGLGFPAIGKTHCSREIVGWRSDDLHFYVLKQIKIYTWNVRRLISIQRSQSLNNVNVFPLQRESVSMEEKPLRVCLSVLELEGRGVYGRLKFYKKRE